jgi:hypothetical protein
MQGYSVRVISLTPIYETLFDAKYRVQLRFGNFLNHRAARAFHHDEAEAAVALFLIVGHGGFDFSRVILGE